MDLLKENGFFFFFFFFSFSFSFFLSVFLPFLLISFPPLFLPPPLPRYVSAATLIGWLVAMMAIVLIPNDVVTVCCEGEKRGRREGKRGRKNDGYCFNSK